MDCVCRLTKERLRDHLISFEQRYGLDKIHPAQGCLLQYGIKCDSPGERQQPGIRRYSNLEILHPGDAGDADSKNRDWLIVSAVFDCLTERARNNQVEEICLTLNES